MAALMSLAQLSSGSPVYDSYYRQVDRGGTGRVGPAEGALFLKKSGLSDSTLGKIWELADPDGKGYLDKQGFFVALRLVSCAQNGRDVSIASLKLPLAPPKFSDTSSPSLSTTSSTDSHWAVRVEERGKFEGVFESLSPVNGLLSGEKVKPVLINSNLPLDVLGRIWDLSDIDKDGHLDTDEFAVAMHLVYRARELEPVPSSLPASLIPPSKRKKPGGSLPGSVPVLPPPHRESVRSPLTHASASAGTLSPKPSLDPPQPAVSWVVPVADRGRYDELFLKLDSDLDGLVGGGEVKEVFLQSGLSQALLAHIWTLADTRQKGKLTREQFSLAMHLVQQKVKKGLEPPQALTPDMLPPSDRAAPLPVHSSSLGSVEFTGVKELDDISQEIAELQREKFALEQEIREKEEAIRMKNNDVQVMQGALEREGSGLQNLASQKQDAQGRLEEMDQQKSKLESMLGDVQLKCQEESQLISSAQGQIETQEAGQKSQEEELSRAKSDLARLQQEEVQLEQSIQAGQSQLHTIGRSLRVTQDEITQARSRLAQIRDSQEEVTRSIEQCNAVLNGGSLSDMEDSFKTKASSSSSVFGSHSLELSADPFHSDDPFKSDPFKDPFGEDPFRESDPFTSTSSEDFFSKTLPSKAANSSSPKTKGPEPVRAGPHGNKVGFADFSKMSQRVPGDSFGREQDMQSQGPKKVLPSRPTPPRAWK